MVPGIGYQLATFLCLMTGRLSCITPDQKKGRVWECVSNRKKLEECSVDTALPAYGATAKQKRAVSTGCLYSIIAALLAL